MEDCAGIAAGAGDCTGDACIAVGDCTGDARIAVGDCAGIATERDSVTMEAGDVVALAVGDGVAACGG
jgi:hypothetical protein